jgi:hypothetical protein
MIKKTAQPISSKPGKVSSTEKGDSFRNVVAALLRTKHETVEIEKSLAGKNVDIYYTETRYSKVHRIAVECKNYGKNLTATDFSRHIIPDYAHLFGKEIDLLLVIGNSPIGPAASARIKDNPNVCYLTYEELEEELLGFKPYIESLKQASDAQGWNSYYIETRFESDQSSAYDRIQEWMEEDEAPPLAILGGYGQGKTSFANRIVALQAREYLKDPRKRMPIIIRLGEIVHETTLEGLFGREFTSRFRSRYHFDTFRHLNESGRLLIVLDGFDEMKHGMKASDFRSNFSEFNRLIVPRSKVILLGRPSAFSSGIRQLVLRGRKVVGNAEIEVPNMRPWLEKEIASFSRTEVKKFLEGYLAYLISMNATRSNILSPARIPGRIDEILADVDPSLLSRPVHARIVAELAVSPKLKFKGFNEYELYSQFIRQIIERDAEQKPARKRISTDQRLIFQQRLAFWAWSRSSQAQGSFLREEIPKSLLSGLDDGDTYDDEAKLNEYIVSTVTDAKESEHLYFAHRSFQEFLVAECLRNHSQDGIYHEKRSSVIDEAISLFLLGSPDLSFLDVWYESLPYGGTRLSSLYLSLFINRKTILESINRKIEDEAAVEVQYEESGISVEETCIVGLAACKESSGAAGSQEPIRFLKWILLHGSGDAAAVAYHFLLRVLSSKSDLVWVLCTALGERQDLRMIILKRSSRANRFTLAEDAVEASTKPALEKSRAGKRTYILWDINRTYSNVTRLVRLRNKLLLDDAPPEIPVADSSDGLLRLEKSDVDPLGLDLDFRGLGSIAQNEPEQDAAPV